MLSSVHSLNQASRPLALIQLLICLVLAWAVSLSAQQPTSPPSTDNPYAQARTAAVTLTLGTTTPSSTNARLAKLTALAGGDAPTTPVALQPQAHGGVVLLPDASGNPQSHPEGGSVLINVLGQATFAFQSPAPAGRYQIVVRLDNVSTILPFLVADPSLNY